MRILFKSKPDNRETNGQVSEQILNGTSAQLGHTVPFTSVRARKYVTETKNTNQEQTL